MADLVRAAGGLSEADLEWLHRLVADWQLLADVSFADLILWVARPAGAGFVAVAHIRPTTGPTCYLDDRVGRRAELGERPGLQVAWTEGRIYREGDPDWRAGTPIREEAIPVRFGGRIIALITRETNLAAARTPSRLELAYLECAADLAQMVAEGRFPIPGPADEGVGGELRVGDGLIRLDATGRVTFASPNALSAYRRLGLTGDLLGAHLGAVTSELLLVPTASRGPIIAVAEGRAARTVEVDANGSIVELRAIPLLPGGRRIGAMVLMHDVTELRRRDRALSGKDAIIREIHHRVKNNLQTVAALLRLQSRRLSAVEARAALEESVRRVGAIALVHETLSQTLDEEVGFDEIADRVIAMVGDVSSLSPRVTVSRRGSFGTVPGGVASSLALVLTELLQNAAEHAFGTDAGGPGRIEVIAAHGPEGLILRVRDDGAGLSADFSLEGSAGLGLQIVSTLISGELRGTLTVRARGGGGTEAVVALPGTALIPPAARQR